jgi:hypothetical protein
MEPAFNKQAMTLTITVENDDGEEIELEFPAKFEVCGRCDGKGTHVNPNVDGHGLSQEDFDEDPDFRENYFSGMYDVTCHECHGERLIAVFDYERMTDEQKVVVDDYAQYRVDLASEERWGY